MKEKVGVIGFSFALRKDGEPNPCNKRLANEVMRAVRHLTNHGKESVVVVQWEIALALPKKQKVAYIVREHRVAGQYLDSEEVMDQVAEALKAQGVTKVIVIANRFLHLDKCKNLARKVFTVLKFKVRRIGFDKKSDQWGTRGPLQCLVYSILRSTGFGKPAQP